MKHSQETQMTTYDQKGSLRRSNTVQQYVKGEGSNGFEFFSAASSIGEIQEPEVSTNTAEPQLTDKTGLAEGVPLGEVKPVPTAQQRRFSVDWDPIR